MCTHYDYTKERKKISNSYIQKIVMKQDKFSQVRQKICLRNDNFVKDEM